jgi:hypothetical protein
MNRDDLVPDALPGGMADIHGCWHDHYWVESREFGLRVDVTADQFGHAPALVSASDDPLYNANWTDEAVRRHGVADTATAREWTAGFRARGTAPRWR